MMVMVIQEFLDGHFRLVGSLPRISSFLQSQFLELILHLHPPVLYPDFPRI